MTIITQFDHQFPAILIVYSTAQPYDLNELIIKDIRINPSLQLRHPQTLQARQE
jgi:hypothetical protein